MRPRLSSGGIKTIKTAIDLLFDKLRAYVIGDKHPTGKRLYIAYNKALTLKAIYDAAAADEGVTPHEDVFSTLKDISISYLDATKAKMQAKTIKAVQDFLTDAHNSGVETDLKTVLGGKLYEVAGEVTTDLKRILQTESTTVRNVSIMDGIVRSNAAAGIDDPTVVFLTVNDSLRCDECTRLHLLADKITPRAWKLSEVGSGHHKKGESTPKISGLHPNDRCVLTTILPGYGFNSAGKVQYKSPGWDEFKFQRGLP